MAKLNWGSQKYDAMTDADVADAALIQAQPFDDVADAATAVVRTTGELTYVAERS